MKRPLVLFSLALMAGIIAASASGSYFLIFSTTLLAISIIIAISRRLPILVLYISIGTLIFYSAGAFEYLYLSKVNEKRFLEYADEQVIIRGLVDSEADIRELRVLYIIIAKEIECSGKAEKVGGKILLTVMKNADTCYLDYGREIEISGRLTLPKGRRNPGAFDYRRYLAQSGISGLIFADRDNIKAGVNSYGNPLIKSGLAVRRKIINVIDKSLPEQQAGLLNGMLIGYREGLSDNVQEVFSDAGLTHIMAVSGANIAFIMMPLLFVFKKLRLRQIVSNIIVIGILVFFVFVTGFEASVMRAVIMAIVILSGQILRREADIYTSLAFAAVLLLLQNPYTLFNIGFQLSFAATLSLVLFYRNIKSMIKIKLLPGFVSDTLAATVSAQLGVLPITALYFNKVSIISVASNLIVVPVLEVITIAGSLMAVLGQFSITLSRIIGYANCTFLSFVLFISRITADFPYAVIRIVTPSCLILIVYYLLVAFFLWYKPMHKPKIKPVYYMAVSGAAVIIICVSILLPKQLEVFFIDVGQGDSVFIRTSTGRTVLIDGGGKSSKLNNGSDIGETVIIPFLLDYGVSKLDLVVATHGHDDHLQGLIPVLRDLEVENLVLPDNGNEKEFDILLEISGSKDTKVSKCSRGDTIRLDNKTFLSVLHPVKGFRTINSSLNNGSLVLKLNYMEASVLLTGDIEKEVEELLLKDGAYIEADVLKVAHHGSDTSTTREFLDGVEPKAAVISVGNNNFGHPSASVVERLKDTKIQLFRTDVNGAVILTTNGRKIRFKSMISRQ